MAKPAPKSAPKTINDFRAAHDKNVIVPNKIRAALDAILKEGPENWEYEADLIRRAGVSTTDLATFRDQFEDHIVETSAGRGSRSKRVWFGSTKVAAKVRGSV